MGNFSRLWRGLGVVVMLCLAMGAHADDATYMSQAENANEQLQYNLNRLSDSEKSSLAQSVAELKAMAAELDRLKSDIDDKQQKVTAAQADYDAANSSATALRQQADQTDQNGRSQVNQIVQSVNGICTQMGGAVSGQECVFTCPQNQQQVCAQKVAAFDNQIAQLKSQIESIAQGIQDAEQKAQAAEADAKQKQQAVQEAQSAVDDVNKELASKAEDFRKQLQAFSDAMAEAEKRPFNIHMGPAYHQLVATNNNMQALAGAVNGQLARVNQTCFDSGEKCFDMGANSDGTLVVAAVPNAPPSVPAEKVSQLQTEMQNLTKQYNDIHDRLRQAEANRDPGVGDLIKQLSSIQGQVEMQAYRLKSYHINMTQVATPAH